MTSQTTTHTSYPRLSQPRGWRRRGAPAAALTLALALTAAAASGLAATPAWAAGGYHVIATIAVGSDPNAVAVSPSGTRAYVTNSDSSPGSVSVINTATDHVIAAIAVGSDPEGVALSPDGTRAYVANPRQGTVSVINTATNKVTTTIQSAPPRRGGGQPRWHPRLRHQRPAGTVVINTATNMVTTTIPARRLPATGWRSAPMAPAPTSPTSTDKRCQ